MPEWTRHPVGVRIGGPAHRHGVSESDMLHAVRTALHRVVMDEDLTMLIGPAADGSLLEIGVSGLGGGPRGHPRDGAAREAPPAPGEGERLMRHTDEAVDQAAARFEQLADELDPQGAVVVDAADLQQVASASQTVKADEVRLREAVLASRGRGRSWNQIAIALGVSRQAARQRFAERTPA